MILCYRYIASCSWLFLWNANFVKSIRGPNSTFNFHDQNRLVLVFSACKYAWLKIFVGLTKL